MSGVCFRGYLDPEGYIISYVQEFVHVYNILLHITALLGGTDKVSPNYKKGCSQVMGDSLMIIQFLGPFSWGNDETSSAMNPSRMGDWDSYRRHNLTFDA